MGSKRRSELRQEMIKILASLDERWVEAASHEISGRLTQLLNSQLEFPIKHILACNSFSVGEVDLSNFISEQLGERQVYLPRMQEDGEIQFISLGEEWLDAIEAGEVEPEGEVFEAGNLYQDEFGPETLVIVPGMAFDSFGSRLGRGQGRYERFLRRPGLLESVKVGVCWSLQMVKELPAESHEIIMDWVCHEHDCLRTGVLFEEE